jgi:hypothetical protein
LNPRHQHSPSCCSAVPRPELGRGIIPPFLIGVNLHPGF